MASNKELLAKARFHAGQIIDGHLDPVLGGQIIWRECSLNCEPSETSLDPFVYWVSEFENADDTDRGIFCRRAIVEVARVFLDPERDAPPEYRDPDPAVFEAIQAAEQLIDLDPAPDGEDDPRWQAIIAVSEFLETSPEPIWQFIRKWGIANDDDLQSAIATCLLEHPLECHFDAYFDRMATFARADRTFAKLFLWCCKGGQSEYPLNSSRWDALERELRRRRRRR